MAETVHSSGFIPYDGEFEVVEDSSLNPPFTHIATELGSGASVPVYKDGNRWIYQREDDPPAPDFRPHTKWDRNDADGRYYE